MPSFLRFACGLLLCLPLGEISFCLAGDDDSKDAKTEVATDKHEDNKGDSDGDQEEAKDLGWDIESAPGPTRQQAIDTREGTWINLDVSPNGKTIVFDLLGDIYSMPIIGADGKKKRGLPQKLTTGIAWDMQPRFSPDGKHIAFTSDRNGKSKKAGDNIWTMPADGGGEPSQVTNESYRLFNGPAWSPDGKYIVARKHFTSRRSLGAGEMWMFDRDAVAKGATAGLQLTKKPNDQKDVNEPVFSPDGKYLYYSLDATPGGTFEYDKNSHSGIYAIKRLELESGETEILIRGPGGACRPTPSPDGKQLAFVRRVGAKTGLHCARDVPMRANSAPRIRLPAPTTTAISACCAARFSWSATCATTSGSKPTSPGRARLSPLILTSARSMRDG